MGVKRLSLAVGFSAEEDLLAKHLEDLRLKIDQTLSFKIQKKEVPATLTTKIRTIDMVKISVVSLVIGLFIASF